MSTKPDQNPVTMPDLYSEPIMYKRISASASWSIGDARHRAATEIGSQLQRHAPLGTSKPTDASVRIFVDQSGIADNALLRSLPNDSGHFYAIVPAPAPPPPQLERPSPPSTTSLHDTSTPSIFRAMSSPIGDTLRGHIQKVKNVEKEMAKMKRDFSREKNEMKRDFLQEKNDLKASMQRLEEKMEEKEEKMEEMMKEMKREQRDMEAQLADTAGFLVHGHTEALDRIRLRNLLDDAQAVLADACGLVSTGSDSDSDTVTPAQQWRIHLAKAGKDRARFANAQSMLKGLVSSASESDPIRQFMASPSGDLALIMVTQKFSPIRKAGDAIVHERQLNPTMYENVIGRCGGSPAQQAALRSLLALVNSYKH